MELYKFDKDSLSFTPVSYVKWLKLWTAFTAVAMIWGITRPPRTEVIEKLTPVEKFIVINEANTFSPEKLREEIKRLNFNFPELVYAQSYVETGNWTSRIYKENNNLFGMKEAQIRAHTSIGTQHKHALYLNWKESLWDYALYYSEYLSDIRTEEDYLLYINQRYAEHPEYDVLVKDAADKFRHYFHEE